jgi:hypothetical protein
MPKRKYDDEDFLKKAAHILERLTHGPQRSFGSDRFTDRVLQQLKKDGRIRFVPKCRGGQGWELTKETPCQST